MNPIVIKFDATFSEYQQCARLIEKRDWWSRIWWPIYIVGIVALAASAGITMPSLASGLSAIGLLVFATGPWIVAYAAQMRQREAFERARAAEPVLTFSADGVTWTSTNLASQIGWGWIERVVETDRFYALIHGRWCACITKRSIPADRKDDFAALMRR
ncbi:MAG TPA: YcxB family protein [Candidatus Cybelea sp.]|nr:YcxB family protein [Candidatus Cybelea sp.]